MLIKCGKFEIMRIPNEFGKKHVTCFKTMRKLVFSFARFSERHVRIKCDSTVSYLP